MEKNRFVSLLLLSAIAVLTTALPAHAEFAWNPFEHMTPDESRDTIFLIIFMFFFFLAGFPLLLGALSYWALKYKYPDVPAKLKTVLLYTYGAYWVGNLATKLVPEFPWPSMWHTPFQYLAIIVGIGTTIGGAVLGYFRKPKTAASSSSEIDASA